MLEALKAFAAENVGWLLAIIAIAGAATWAIRRRVLAARRSRRERERLEDREELEARRREELREEIDDLEDRRRDRRDDDPPADRTDDEIRDGLGS